jgi:hypothetical protein
MIKYPKMIRATTFFASVAHSGVSRDAPLSLQRIAYDLSFVKKRKKNKSYLR